MVILTPFRIAWPTLPKVFSCCLVVFFHLGKDKAVQAPNLVEIESWEEADMFLLQVLLYLVESVEGENRSQTYPTVWAV